VPPGMKGVPPMEPITLWGRKKGGVPEKGGGVQAKKFPLGEKLGELQGGGAQEKSPAGHSPGRGEPSIWDHTAKGGVTIWASRRKNRVTTKRKNGKFHEFFFQSWGLGKVVEGQGIYRRVRKGKEAGHEQLSLTECGP